MSSSEFDLIARYFSAVGPARADVVLGVGDDAAVLRVPGGMELVVAMDTLVAGVHFPVDAHPEDIGHKALAVNLSDLAAMGALPAWATLALTLPHADEGWLAAFSGGMGALARRHGVQLVGGDTTRGPLTITVQVHGFVPQGQYRRRADAQPGDLIYVTGTLGDAALALQAWLGEITLTPPYRDALYSRLHRPEPRVVEGLALRDLAHAVIDVSDGLLADLGHILAASGVGATVDVDSVPLSAGFRAASAPLQFALAGGDDYELCFTVPPHRRAVLEPVSAAWPAPCACIGVIVDAPGLNCVHVDGRAYDVAARGYDHFRDNV